MNIIIEGIVSTDKESGIGMTAMNFIEGGIHLVQIGEETTTTAIGDMVHPIRHPTLIPIVVISLS